MLSWKQIELRAIKFSEEWADASYEKGEAQSFYNDLFEVFGIKRRSVARFEERVKKLNNKPGFIDVFWPGVFLAEQKSTGKSLDKATAQAGEYFDLLKEEDRPRYQLVCDFQTFWLIDRDSGTSIRFSLPELFKHIRFFGFMLGKLPPQYRPKEPLNYTASEHIAYIYKGLSQTGYPEGDLEKYVTRLVFCLFADNTGIFQPKGCFLDLIEARTKSDGSDLGLWISQLYQVLNCPYNRRQSNLDVDLAQFPFINGGLFAEALSIPCFNEQVRIALLDALCFNWGEISPAIFGSFFQNVLSRNERRQSGGHSTDEPNILKVINDLFLIQLKNEFIKICQSSVNKHENLVRFHGKLRSLKFFDPACGCGNFLAIAYREIRKLELLVLIEINKLHPLDLTSQNLSLVNVDQFFGIENRPYSAKIAETAMWMTDHIANNELSFKFGIDYHRVPLLTAPRIVIDDALSLDWSTVVPSSESLVVFGNPPYGGSKEQTLAHRTQIQKLARISKSGGTLDYVCGWILKAAEYAAAGARIGFITTNSISQGEQAGQLWPILYNRFHLDISFAHQSFLWESNGPGSPRVQVIILGLDSARNVSQDKKLYTYATATSTPVLQLCRHISPYLIVGDNLTDPHTAVHAVRSPLNGFHKLRTGTKPIDGGYYIFTNEEKDAFLKSEPRAAKYFRPFIGGAEFLEGGIRHILVLSDVPSQELRSLPQIMDRIQKVSAYRKAQINNKSGKAPLKAPNDLWPNPTKFHIKSFPNKPFLVIPEVTSERRQYVPIAWIEPPVIPSNLVKYVANPSLVDFALLTSAMHMTWLRKIGGTLEGRYRYSIGVVYNTFPVPAPNEINAPRLERLAQGILDARANHPGQSLEALYDPDVMPEDLRRAHQTLDREVDRIYLGISTTSEQDRIVNLLNRYSHRHPSGLL